MTYASRAGFFGNYDVLVNLVKGVRYQREPTTSLTGAFGGNVSELIASGIKYFTDEGKGNSAERKLAKDFYNTILQPLLIGAVVKHVPGGVVPAAAIQAISHPVTKEAF